MVVDVTPAFVEYTAGNRGPTPTDPDASEHPDYGLAATLDGTTIDLILTFRAGATYCCGEWPCHFLLFSSNRWDKLRRALAAGGVEVAGQLELRVEVIIEEGALFLWRQQMVPSLAYRYRNVVVKGAAWNNARCFVFCQFANSVSGMGSIVRRELAGFDQSWVVPRVSGTGLGGVNRLHYRIFDEEACT